MDDAIPNIDASKMKNTDKEKIERMRARDHKVPYLFYPEDPFKEKVNKNINFFNLGKNNDWTKLLDKSIANQISLKFEREMK